MNKLKFLIKFEHKDNFGIKRDILAKDILKNTPRRSRI